MRHWFVIVAVAALSACALPTTEDPSELPTLNEAAQGKRFAAFQAALEYGRSDQPVQWQVSAELRGSVTPIDTVRSRTDGWCRSYEELIADGTKRYRVVGIACRKAPRRWLVLDVRPFTEGR
jgi:surface antigen